MKFPTSIRPNAAGPGGPLPPIRRLSIIRTSRKKKSGSALSYHDPIHRHSPFSLFINNHGYDFEPGTSRPPSSAAPLPLRFLIFTTLDAVDRSTENYSGSTVSSSYAHRPLGRTSPLSVSLPPPTPFLLSQV